MSRTVVGSLLSSIYEGISGDVTATSREMMTSSTVGGSESESSLLQVWCATTNQHHLLPHLLHQHIANRFHHFRSCYTLPPEMMSSPWAPEFAPETRARRQRAEELRDVELDDDEEEDAMDTEARRSRTPQPSSQLDQGRVVGCRKKKTRTVFSRAQVLQLESTFDAKRYLSSAERSNLAASLQLSETQVGRRYCYCYDHAQWCYAAKSR